MKHLTGSIPQRWPRLIDSTYDVLVGEFAKLPAAMRPWVFTPAAEAAIHAAYDRGSFPSVTALRWLPLECSPDGPTIQTDCVHGTFWMIPGPTKRGWSMLFVTTARSARTAIIPVVLTHRDGLAVFPTAEQAAFAGVAHSLDGGRSAVGAEDGLYWSIVGPWGLTPSIIDEPAEPAPRSKGRK